MNKITDDRLQYVIHKYEATNTQEELADDMFYQLYKELQTLRKRLSAIAHIKANTSEEFDWAVLDKIFKLEQQNKVLNKIANKMAQILSDGEGKADQICCVDFYHARDAVYEHKELTKLSQ